GLRLSLNPEQRLIVTLQWHCTPGKRGGFYAAGGVDLPLGFAKSCANLVGTRVVERRWKREVERKDVVRIEARIHIPQAHKSTHHQSSTDKQHQGGGQLNDDEHALRARARAAEPASIVLESAEQIPGGNFEGRRQTEESSGHHRDYKCECQYVTIECYAGCTRQGLRKQRQSCMSSPLRQQQSEQAAAHGKQHALGKKLADNPALGRTQGKANSKFAAARSGSRQQEIGDVHAGDQENEPDSAKQHQQHRLAAANHLFLKWEDGRANALVDVRIGGSEIASDGKHIRPCLLEGHARLQTANAVD